VTHPRARQKLSHIWVPWAESIQLKLKWAESIQLKLKWAESIQLMGLKIQLKILSWIDDSSIQLISILGEMKPFENEIARAGGCEFSWFSFFFQIQDVPVTRKCIPNGI
jgi:hypothetical protein